MHLCSTLFAYKGGGTMREREREHNILICWRTMQHIICEELPLTELALLTWVYMNTIMLQRKKSSRVLQGPLLSGSLLLFVPGLNFSDLLRLLQLTWCNTLAKFESLALCKLPWLQHAKMALFCSGIQYALLIRTFADNNSVPEPFTWRISHWFDSIRSHCSHLSKTVR